MGLTSYATKNYCENTFRYDIVEGKSTVYNRKTKNGYF